MTKINFATLKELSSLFLSDFAAKFEMPQAASTRPTFGEEANAIEVQFSIVPTGPMAFSQRQADFRIVVTVADDGLVYALVETSYEHHNGGSNGKNRRFLLDFDTRYGNEDVVYHGFVDEDSVNRFQRKFDTIRHDHQQERISEKKVTYWAAQEEDNEWAVVSGSVFIPMPSGNKAKALADQLNLADAPLAELV